MDNLYLTKLRALSGVILLILAIASMITKYTDESLKIIMISLAGFLVGAALVGGKKQQ